MRNSNLGHHRLFLLMPALVVFAASCVVSQDAERPSMNSKLSLEQRADLVLKQMTLDEKLALLHGNGMGHVPQWQMPLTYLGNGGAGYVEGVQRLGIPPLAMSDAAY